MAKKCEICFKIVLFIFLIINCSCNDKIPEQNIVKAIINDSEYVRNFSFKVGDVRRYGVYPDSIMNQYNLKNVILLSSKGIEMTFPKGVYKTDINLKGVKNLKFIFKNSILCGALNITEKDSILSENLILNGKLKILDKLFIRNSSNVKFDSIILTNNININLRNKKNRGVSIYVNSKNIEFNYIQINDSGGEPNDYFKYTAASLQVHGWQKNPSNLRIKELEINNASRSGLYLTGSNHKITKVTINNFGIGSNKNMFGLEDAKPGEEKKFTGAWINQCNNSNIDTLVVNYTHNNKSLNSLKFGEGKYIKPTFINNIRLENDAKHLNVIDSKLTNILVKNEF